MEGDLHQFTSIEVGRTALVDEHAIKMFRLDDVDRHMGYVTCRNWNGGTEHVRCNESISHANSAMLLLAQQASTHERGLQAAAGMPRDHSQAVWTDTPVGTS